MYEIETRRDRITDPAIKHYLTMIARYPLLQREQEEDLARRVRTGDKEALDLLVNANLRFVVNVAKRFLNRGLGLMDLIAEGNVGLITAARKFDERRGARFVTYAVWWIQQSIQTALQNHVRPVRLPANQLRLIPALLQAEQALEQTKGGAITPEDLAGKLGIPLNRLRRIQKALSLPVSLDNQDETDGGSLAESLPDEDLDSPLEAITRERLERRLAQAMAELEGREQDIVSRHYGLDQDQGDSLEAIGRSQSLSRERVRQLRNRALGKIRDRLDPEEVSEYLG